MYSWLYVICKCAFQMLFQDLPLLLYHIFQMILHPAFALRVEAMLEINSYFLISKDIFTFKKVAFSQNIYGLLNDFFHKLYLRNLKAK